MQDYFVNPYIVRDGRANYPDEFITGLYHRIVEEGTIDRIYSEAAHSPEAFLECMQQWSLFILYYKGELAGIAWLNDFHGKSARVHFCMFKYTWGKPFNKTLGKFTADYMLNIKGPDGEYLLDTLIGSIPVSNPLSLKYARSIGFKYLGVIPGMHISKRTGKAEGVSLTYYTRESEDEDL